jgi:hypothetical protein
MIRFLRPIAPRLVLSRHIAAAFVASALATAPACGGASDPKPMPVKKHFDDMHIAQVEIAEKQNVVQAQNDFSIAKMEHAKAEADFNEVRTKIKIAENERDQALLSEKSAGHEKKSADDSSDMNRVNSAMRSKRAAELSRKAADEKVSYLKEYRNYLQKHMLYTEWNRYAAEARFELAKAKVAQAKNIRPKDFEIADYEKQYKQRADGAKKAHSKAETAKKKAETKKKKWQALVNEANKAGGSGKEQSAL